MRDPNKIVRRLYQHGIYLTGSRAALVAAGVCNASPFPCDPEDKRTTDARGVRHGEFIAFDPHGRQIKIITKGRQFEVFRRDLTELERAEATRDECKREQQEREREERETIKRARESREIEEREVQADRTRYATAEEFKAVPCGSLPMILEVATSSLTSGCYGWRLCDEDRARLVSLKAQLADLISKARVVRDGEEPQPRLRLVKA